MASNLTPEQIAALRAAGFTPNQIAQYTSGQSEFALKSNIERTLGTNMRPSYQQQQAKGTTADTGPGGWSALGSAISGGPNPSGWAKFFGFGNSVASSAGKQAAGKVDFANGQRSVAPADYAQTARVRQLNAVTNRYNKGVGTANAAYSRVQDIISRIREAKGQASEDPMAGYPEYPNMGNYAVPTISPQDFSAEARSMADTAFAPVLAMLEQSKTNVSTEGERSRQIVGGLYEKMVADIAEEAAKQSARYDESKAGAATSGNDLQFNIGQNYGSANANVAELLQKIGGQQAAPELLQRGADDQAYQQSRAASDSQAQQNYYEQQQQGQADYNQQLGNIQRNEGVNAQSNILNQVRQMLANIDAQKASTQAESAQTALNIGNQLTDRDLSVQQANAGFQMQGADSARQAALAQYGASTDRWNAGQQLEQQAYANQQGAQQQQFDNNIALGQLGLDQAAAGAQAGSAASTPKGLATSRAGYEAQAPGVGARAFDAALKILQDFQGSSADPSSMGNYLRAVRAYAVANNINEDQAALIAADIYQQAFGNG